MDWALHMDSADLDLMVRPLDHEDRLEDMDLVLPVDILDIEVDIDDIEGLADSQDVQGEADNRNNHDSHMVAYHVVDTDQVVVDNQGGQDDWDKLEDDSQGVPDGLVVDIRADHFDVQVHSVYWVVMLVHLTLVIAVLKSGVLVELEVMNGTVVLEGPMRTTVVKVVGLGHVDFDEVILNGLILEGCCPHLHWAVLVSVAGT